MHPTLRPQGRRSFSPTCTVTADPDLPESPRQLWDSLRILTPELYPWMLLSLSVYLFGMPNHFSPCAAKTMRNVEYAEELDPPTVSSLMDGAQDGAVFACAPTLWPSTRNRVCVAKIRCHRYSSC
ncbi:hypothetical protein K438DRAFT_2027598 [Mycena galopus ATCC 62051]|nr:hypothetical protein K438DRAFT_2027598 [Mycena galopus ATCC 62051]